MEEVRAVLGLVDFYKKFLPGWRQNLEPVYQLLKKEKKFSWTKECEDALQELKRKLQSALILG